MVDLGQAGSGFSTVQGSVSPVDHSKNLSVDYLLAPVDHVEGLLLWAQVQGCPLGLGPGGWLSDRTHLEHLDLGAPGLVGGHPGLVLHGPLSAGETGEASDGTRSGKSPLHLGQGFSCGGCHPGLEVDHLALELVPGVPGE